MSKLQDERGIDINLRSGPQMLEYEAIADRIAANAPGELLDWGCGWGQVTDLLLRRGVSTTPFDYREGVDPARVEPLERFPHISAHVYGGDPVRLPFDDDAFDAVLSCGVLEHVRSPDDSLEEIKRVLRPGGVFYVYKLPNRFSYLEAVARVAGLYHHGQLPDDEVYTATGSRRHDASTSCR
jgi:ubiquinone/menaquinone biosynthesis C-methylase UbiE